MSLTPREENVLLEVADSGLGVSPELLPHIFKEFLRDERVRELVKELA